MHFASTHRAVAGISIHIHGGVTCFAPGWVSEMNPPVLKPHTRSGDKAGHCCVHQVVRRKRKDGESMSTWRIYVGGLLMGFAIGGFAVWCAAWTIVPPSARTHMGVIPGLFLPFALAGETLRMRGSKPSDKQRPG
jgi:hypothetical protein